MVDHNDSRETVERTTIIETDRGGGSGGLLAVILLLLAILAALFLFRDSLGFGGKTEVKVPESINVNVN